ncbi:hypothetical protein ACWJJH_04140 [Endozoicomonadaceae bacterium StTr2]
MAQGLFLLDQSGVKHKIACDGRLLIELGNGTTLELCINDIGKGPEPCALPVEVSITGQEGKPAQPSDASFAVLQITPGACNVVHLSAKALPRDKSREQS